jgi:starch-binding outer membrane protein, SusD/RagB family
MNQIIRFTKIIAIALGIGLIFTSCKEFLETPLPNDQLATETVFKSKETIRDVVNGMYAAFAYEHIGFMERNNAACSDEGTLPNNPGNALGDMVFASITPLNGVLLPWETLYKTIYRANLILENLPDVPVTVLSETDKNLYMAAARFVRAETNFFLVNTWGNVPLVTTTDASVNSAIPQTPAADVYALIVSDLETAVAGLPETVTATPTVHNKFQALALLARVYLYLGRWADAEATASGVISSGKYQMVSVLADVFKKGSPESILSIAETSNSRLYVNRAPLGWMSLPTSSATTLTTYPYVPDQELSKIQTGDQRWVNGNWAAVLYTKTYQNKYRHNSLAADAVIAAYPQHYILLRYSEQFLIRAEARAQLNKITEAAADLNVVRKRAGLPNTVSADKASMLTAIETERQFELFYEGHRWFDLARTNRLDAVLGTLPWKKDNWKSHYRYMPVPDKEMILNPKLVQNQGY